MKKLFAILMLATCGYPAVAPAVAQESAMLRRGVYTNAEISRRCQDYVNRRMSDTTLDRSRGAVFMACVQKLSRNENVGPGAPAGYPSGYGAPPPPMIEAPVALPTYGGGWSGVGTCSTDEGYGRRGSCDLFF